MAKRTIKKQSGYPTTDGGLHDKHSDAVKHQSKLDLNKACEDDGVDIDVIIELLKKNKDIVVDYIKHNLEKKKSAADKKAAAPKAAKDKDKA